MPNWCVNKLSVKGNKDEVAKVKALFINDKDKVDFNIVTPMSPNLDGVTDSHSWKKEYWGTKWNACHSSNETEPMPITDNENQEICYIFDTAWAEPTDWYQALLLKIDALELNSVEVNILYGESGFEFGGEITRNTDGTRSSRTMPLVEIDAFVKERFS